MNKYINKIKRSFSWKKYYLICGILIFYSFIQMITPVFHGAHLYSYGYGFFHPWLVIYKNHDIGISNIVQCISANGYKGLEWFPQYIFIDAGIVYLIGAMIKKVLSL